MEGDAVTERAVGRPDGSHFFSRSNDKPTIGRRPLAEHLPDLGKPFRTDVTKAERNTVKREVELRLDDRLHLRLLVFEDWRNIGLEDEVAAIRIDDLVDVGPRSEIGRDLAILNIGSATIGPRWPEGNAFVPQLRPLRLGQTEIDHNNFDVGEIDMELGRSKPVIDQGVALAGVTMGIENVSHSEPPRVRYKLNDVVSPKK
uniref:Uncharacterized protein n=1 Tax=mine drainage metagenome TaxID=410659 RepID=E6QWM1_9ZZZZ